MGRRVRPADVRRATVARAGVSIRMGRGRAARPKQSHSRQRCWISPIAEMRRPPRYARTRRDARTCGDPRKSLQAASASRSDEPSRTRHHRYAGRATHTARGAPSPPGPDFVRAECVRTVQHSVTGNRTAQHGRRALTWENTTNRHRRTPVITAQICLLICGFGVQVPGGAHHA